MDSSYLLDSRISSKHHRDTRLDNSSDFKVSCEICKKKFRSSATLQAHFISPRHLWKLERFMMTSFNGHSTDTEGEPMSIEYVTDSDRKVLDEMATLRNEGFSCQEGDPKKSTLLFSKAGKGFIEVHDNKQARECLRKAIELANECLKRSKAKMDDVEENDVFVPNDINNNNSNSNNNTMNGENGHTRTQTKSRIKRHRMEQMSKMYSKYKLQRGTADLYETMIQCYAESFEIKLEGQDGGSTSGSNLNSFKKSEILMNRDLVLKELADTENTYVDSLQFLVEQIIPVYKKCESELLKESISNIFANIAEIYEWHKSVFLEKIEDCLEDPELLGPTFKEHEEELTNLYETYCQNKPRADDLIVEFAEDIDLVYQQIETNYTILDYLIKPVQRVMKYQLLLQSIIKYTKKMNEDTKSIEDALEVMEIVPKKVNDKMHLAMITGYSKDLERHKLVLQDTLNVAFGGGKAKPKKYRLFLFEDVLLMTETIERVARLPQYKFILEVKTCRMGVTQTVENDRLRFAIWVRKFKTTDIYVCHAETKEVKENWLKALGDVLGIHGAGITKGTIRNDHVHEQKKPNRSLRAKTWSAEEIIRQATVGHPREYSMSTKLKANIHKFVMENLMLAEQDERTSNNKENEHESERMMFVDIRRGRNSSEGGGSSDGGSDEDKYVCGENGRTSLTTVNEEDGSRTVNKNDIETIKSKEENLIGIGQSDQNERRVKPWRTNGNRNCGKRSWSLPAHFEYDDYDVDVGGFGDVIDNKYLLDTEEIFKFETISAEAQFLLVQTAASLSWDDAVKHLNCSLSLFFDVPLLEKINRECLTREDLARRCSSVYQDLKRRDDFGNIQGSSELSFFSYDGLLRLLITYADLSSETSLSSWPIMLCTLAASASREESRWSDCIEMNRKLSKLYELKNQQHYAVDCLIDSHFIQLELCDVISAAHDLRCAFEVALRSSNKTQCCKLETLALPIIQQSDTSEQNYDILALKLITDMSYAYREHDFKWFDQNYHRILQCDNHSKNKETSEWNELFLYLLEHLKERKQKKSGEVFV